MIRYEIKKLLGSKFIPIFFIIMFALNLLLSYYAAPRSRGELNLHSELDAETQAIVDEMYARYESDPEAFMEEFSSCRAYYLTSIEMTSLVTEKNMEAMMRGEEGNYTIQDFWPEYNDEIRAKVDLYFNTYRYFYRVSGYVTEEYPALLKSVIDNAKLFQEEYLAYGMSADSYEYRYQSDVIDVYSVNKNLPIRFEDRKGWDMYFTYTDGNICMLLFILVLIPGLLLDEKKNGTFPILRATKKGRFALITTKYLTLLLVSAASVLLFNGATWVIFGLESGGYSSLSNFVQIFEVNVYCPYIVTVGEYLGLTLLIKILTLFAVGSLLMTVSLLVKNHALSYLAGLIFGGANFVVHFTDFLDTDHPLRLLNIFTVMDTEVCFTRYHAVNVFGRCLPYLSAIFLFFGLLLLGTALTTGLLYCRTPGVHKVRRRKSRKKWTILTKAIPCPVRLMGAYELHKHLVAGKWLLLILAILLVKGYTVYSTESVAYSFSDAVYQDYMDLLAGEVTDEKLAYMEDERAHLDSILSSEETMKEKYASKEISFAEYMEYQDELDTAKAKDPIFVSVEAQRDHLLSLRQRGIEGDFVYVTGWNRMFSRSFDVILYGFTLVFAAVLFTTEYGAGVTEILRSTKRGRGRLFATKCLLAVTVCGLLAILFGLADHTKLTELYAFTGGLSPVQSLPMLAEIKWNITIHQYLMIFEAVRVLGVMLLAVLTVSVSVMGKKPVNTMAVVALVTVIPFVFRKFGLEIAKYGDFTALLSGNEYMTMAHGAILYGILFTAVLLGGCGGVLLWAWRKWVKA